MTFLKWLDKFHKTATGYTVFAIIELALAFLFAFSALSTGNLIEWILTLVLLVGVIKNSVKLIGRITYVSRKRQAS